MTSIAKNPLTYLGFGLGLSIGILASTQISFEPADAARFLGAIVGSLVTVSGAISLFFLKESHDNMRRVEMVKKGLVQLRNLCIISTGYLQLETDQKDASLKPVVAHFRRVYSLTEKYQFDDELIADAHFWLSVIPDHHDVDLLFKTDAELDDSKKIKMFAIFENAADNALKKFEKKKRSFWKRLQRQKT